MSKKNQKMSQEIPHVGNRQEIPDRSGSATNREYREIMDEVQTRNTDCRDCNAEN